MQRLDLRDWDHSCRRFSFASGVFMAILAFSLTDIFDTIGTLIGTGEKVGIIASTGDNNESKALDRALYSDLVGTSIGAIAGDFKCYNYVESAAGIGAGGRTGLTSSCGCCTLCHL